MDTVNILRITGFQLFSGDNGDQTLTAIRFDSGTDHSPLIALTAAQVSQLRKALGKADHAALEQAWDR